MLPSGYAGGSYAANYQVFGVPVLGGSCTYSCWSTTDTYASSNQGGVPKVPDSFADGASQTILLAEKYSQCNLTISIYAGDAWSYPYVYEEPYPLAPAFAARAAGVGPTVTFQVQPSWTTSACDPKLPNTGHPSGMNVAMADASVRILDKGISAPTYWAACTPNNSDRLGPDW
jgi:prepilin-type processing-associated H-X9-DG protein